MLAASEDLGRFWPCEAGVLGARIGGDKALRAAIGGVGVLGAGVGGDGVLGAGVGGDTLPAALLPGLL